MQTHVVLLALAHAVVLLAIPDGLAVGAGDHARIIGDPILAGARCSDVIEIEEQSDEVRLARQDDAAFFRDILFDLASADRGYGHFSILNSNYDIFAL